MKQARELLIDRGIVVNKKGEAAIKMIMIGRAFEHTCISQAIASSEIRFVSIIHFILDL